MISQPLSLPRSDLFLPSLLVTPENMILLGLGVAACSLLWFALKRFVQAPQRLPLPPDPSLASTVQTQQPWKAYKEWSKSLGPVMYLKSRKLVILSTLDGALELYERRSKHYSERPPWPMARLLGRMENVGFTPYGDALKQKRKLIHGLLGPHAIMRWNSLLDAQSIKLLQAIRASPEKLGQHVQHNIESTTVQMTYGRDIGDDFSELADRVGHDTSIGFQPGRWLVNTYPILAYVPPWFPGATSQRWARDARELFYKLTRPPFEQVKTDMRKGVAKPSFVRDSLDGVATNGQAPDESIIRATAGSLYSAAVDTTAAAIMTFFLLMTRHPEVQARAYCEIKSVVGDDRLPDLTDRESLPYIDCIIKELFRFHPPVPLLTHSNSKADEYEGYYIPKQSWVVANVWGMLHNEEVYPEPDKFMPERFFDPSGETPRDPRTMMFGFGRRTCPGVHFANSIIYLVVVRTIASYRILPPVSAGGKSELPALEFTTGLISNPKPFRCEIIARSKAAIDLLALHSSTVH